MHISKDLRAAINALLFRTGEQNRKFMLVSASNSPEQYDRALKDRIDEVFEFMLPGCAGRERFICLPNE